jgi:hypothetical protein
MIKRTEAPHPGGYDRNTLHASEYDLSIRFTGPLRLLSGVVESAREFGLTTELQVTNDYGNVTVRRRGMHGPEAGESLRRFQTCLEGLGLE